jgi:NADH-quinone oxidoreductase subunit J
VVAQNIFFALIAAVMIVSALRVVTVSNVVHAALWLVVVMAGAASLYLLLGAEFVGVTQVLVYVGAVMVLLLFGTMLTRAIIGSESDMKTASWWVGIPTAIVLFSLLAFAIVDEFDDKELPSDPALVSVQQISDAFFNPYLVPFFALSFVLLAALVGAIVIARRD